MSLKASATRYARALLDVVLGTSADPAKIEADLAGLARLVRTHPELHNALTDPLVSHPARVRLVETIGARAGADPLVARLVGMLASRGRLELLPGVVEAYRERLLEHGRILRARVTAAAPLAPEQQAALRERLSQATGKDVQVDVDVDPTLIGGLVARIGSTVYDGSIRTQLHKMRQQLVARG